jgi:antirestriction protein ArdC
VAAFRKGYRNPFWLTFKQAGDCKGKIKKGEKATWILYAAKVKKEDEKGEEHEYSFLKWYYVFNVEQTEGIPIEAPPVKPIEEVEAFLEAVGANVTRQDEGVLPREVRPDIPPRSRGLQDHGGLLRRLSPRAHPLDGA